MSKIACDKAKQNKIRTSHNLFCCRCSIDKIRDDGVYLLENGLYMFLYIGLAADPDFIQKLFGVSTPAQINVEAPTLEAFDNPISERVRRVIDTVRYTYFF